MATQWTAGLSDGTALPASTLNQIGAVWETWTPAVTQSGAVTATTTLARYMRIQKLVIAVAKMTITGTGTANNAVTLSLPITANNTAQMIGSGFIYDASANLLDLVICEGATTTTTKFYRDGVGANAFWGIDRNIALANGDVISVTLMYEAA